MNEKQRADFEKWAKTNSFQLDVDKYGSYKSICTWSAWKAWQAAIASVTVELPTLIIDEYDNGDILEYVEMSELKDALSGAGVKYK